MPQIKYEVAGVENVETIPADLVPYYTGRLGYTLVYTDAEAAELKGAELLEAARQAGVEAPTTLTADEKRAAIVEATAPAGEPDLTPATIVPGEDGVPVIVADAVTGTKTVGVRTPTDAPAAPPARTTKRRTAADRGE